MAAIAFLYRQLSLASPSATAVPLPFTSFQKPKARLPELPLRLCYKMLLAPGSSEIGVYFSHQQVVAFMEELHINSLLEYHDDV